jgi:hypothetical protein
MRTDVTFNVCAAWLMPVLLADPLADGVLVPAAVPDVVPEVEPLIEAGESVPVTSIWWPTCAARFVPPVSL